MYDAWEGAAILATLDAWGAITLPTSNADIRVNAKRTFRITCLVFVFMAVSSAHRPKTRKTRHIAWPGL
jgi:hypothetical protein